MVVELCKACGSPKPSVAAVQGDDFCSTRCARIYYGTLTARQAVFHRPEYPSHVVLPLIPR